MSNMLWLVPVIRRLLRSARNGGAVRHCEEQTGARKSNEVKVTSKALKKSIPLRRSNLSSSNEYPIGDCFVVPPRNDVIASLRSNDVGESMTDLFCSQWRWASVASRVRRCGSVARKYLSHPIIPVLPAWFCDKKHWRCCHTSYRSRAAW